MSDEAPTKLWVRTKRKDTEFMNDLHHFTNKWQHVPIGEIRGNYLDDPNLDVREEKPKAPKKAKETAVKEPVEEPSNT